MQDSTAASGAQGHKERQEMFRGGMVQECLGGLLLVREQFLGATMHNRIVQPVGKGLGNSETVSLVVACCCGALTGYRDGTGGA